MVLLQTSLVSSATEIWRLTGICEGERALSMTASVCRTKRLGQPVSTLVRLYSFLFYGIQSQSEQTSS